MAALLLDQWCLHTSQCLSKILSPNRRRRKGASSIGRCLHPPIPTTSGKIWKCIFFTDWNPYTTFCAHSHTLLVDLPILKTSGFLFYWFFAKAVFFCNTHCIDWVNLIVWRQILVDSGTTSSWLHLGRIPHNIRDGVPLFLLLSNLCVGTEDFGWAPAQLSAQSTNTFDTSSVCVVKTDATYMESRTFALTNR